MKTEAQKQLAFEAPHRRGPCTIFRLAFFRNVGKNDEIQLSPFPAHRKTKQMSEQASPQRQTDQSSSAKSADSQFQDVIQRICDGSESALGEFIETYGSHMERYVRKKLNEQLPLRVRFDSQDFVQMVWVSFLCRPRGNFPV
jgi:hypothetical protein